MEVWGWSNWKFPMISGEKHNFHSFTVFVNLNHKEFLVFFVTWFLICLFWTHVGRLNLILRDLQSRAYFLYWRVIRFLVSPIKCQCCRHVETSQLISAANQLAGFYMRETLAFNGLIFSRVSLPYTKWYWSSSSKPKWHLSRFRTIKLK